jgi:hypothetical protein
MAQAKRTIDHETIKQWVEERGGCPAQVKGSGSGDDPGNLRIDYPGFSGRERRLRPATAARRPRPARAASANPTAAAPWMLWRCSRASTAKAKRVYSRCTPDTGDARDTSRPPVPLKQ